MFKLFQNLWQRKLPSTEVAIECNSSEEINQHGNLKSTLEQANSLWQQGKLTDAINLYRQAIEDSSNAHHIYEHLALALKQQDNLAEAYEQLANTLEQQGRVAEAADYFRQAIVLKSLIEKAKEKYQRAIPANSIISSSLQVTNLLEEAFSFQPLSSYSLSQNWQNVTSKNSEDHPLTNFHLGDLAVWQHPHNEIANNAEANSNRIASVYIEQALEHYEQQQWEKAASVCQKAIQIDPNRAEVYKIWGNALQRMGKTAQAMDHYAKVVAIEPNLGAVYIKIGNRYAWQKKWLQASQYYQKAIILQPNFVEAYRHLAYCWHQLGEPEKALECRDKALKLEARQINKDSYRQASKLHLSAHNHQQPQLQKKSTLIKQIETQTNLKDSQLDKAIRRYRQQAQLQPSAKIQTDLGNLYKKKKEWHEAATCYQKAIALNAQYAPAYLNLAKVFRHEGKLEKAAEYLYQALSLKPELTSAKNHFYLGNTFFKQGKLEQAIDCYQQAVTLQPNFSEVYYRLGEIWSRQGQKHQAIECFQKAVDLEPQNPKFHHRLGREFMSQQRWKAAVQSLRRVLELQPTFPNGSSLLNQALAKKLKSSVTSNR
jgi:tetratricopeptide (TPR) repeat protein